MQFKKYLINSLGVQHVGKNYILDKGYPFQIYASYLESLHPYIHMIKLGWTTWSLFSDKELLKKIQLAVNYHIPICLGGTLFEICYSSGHYSDLLVFLREQKINTIEIASGFAVEPRELPMAIKKAKTTGLSVLVEIGYKNQQKDDALNVEDRLKHIKQAFTAGADKVILEAREIGSGYSVFKKNISANQDLLTKLLAQYPLDKVVFEAPTRETQIQLVNALGPDVLMGNIPFEEIPRVETIRRRLHADTYILPK
jgi:phosphosulfolactate synthase